MAKKKTELATEELMQHRLVPEDEQPYEVPDNWVWTRFGFLAIDMADGPFGSNLKREHYTEKKEVRIIQLSNIGENGWKGEHRKYTTYEHAKTISRSIVNTGDIVIAKMMPAGRAIKVPDEEKAYILSSDAVKFIPKNFVNTDYLLYAINSSDFRNQISSETQGITRARTSIGKMKTYAFPLPPLTEQQRIVDRIESLFKKLDQAKELIQNALDSYENRKAAILHKAFTGELTKKWREENDFDSPESVLRQLIQQHSAVCPISKELSLYLKDLLLENIIDNNNWLHIKTMLICDNITCGGTPSGYITAEGDIPFLKVYNIVNNAIDFQYKPQYIDKRTHTSKLKSSILKPRDVVMNIVGPPLRKIAFIPEYFHEWNMNQAIVRFRTIDYIEPKFLYYCLLNPKTLDSVLQDTKGVVGQTNISITQSRNLIIPVPSKQEQSEIIRILDVVFENEQKEKKLYDLIDSIGLMKKSILAQAFRGELGTNNSTDKNALELLNITNSQ